MDVLLALLAVVCCLFGGCVFCLFGGSKGKRPSQSSKSDPPTAKPSARKLDKAMSSRFRDFSLSFLRVASTSSSSFVFSPLALGLGLSMMIEGAEGSTLEEICLVLAKDGSAEDIRSFFSSLSSATPNMPRSLQNSIFNGIYANKKFDLRQEYIDKVARLYKATAENIDFANGTAAAKIVNESVEEETRGLMKQIVSTDDFNQLVHSILVSTIYFQGGWVHPFSKSPREKTFHGLSGDRQEQFMYKEYNVDLLQFSISNDLTTIALPYSSGQDSVYSFVAMMPSGHFGDWKNTLTGEKMREAIEGGKEGEARLTMPKFNVENSINCKEALEAMGVKKIFDMKEADLTGLSKNSPHLSTFIQKAAIDVDENGTRAAAVQESIVSSRSLAEPIDIIIDRPFLFFVLRDDLPLFAGKYV